MPVLHLRLGLFPHYFLLIPTVFTQQYYRLNIQLSKLHVSAFMAIIGLTKDWYQLRYRLVSIKVKKCTDWYQLRYSNLF